MYCRPPYSRLREAAMSALIDVDQLRTFIAIVETGSFTKAAEVVHKTQSAVSMQMKRLEERLGRPIFARDGRASKLTEDGERLLDYARRIVKLNVEALAAFDDAELTGRVRLGVPDDYADRYLPEIMARFSRAYPGVELTVMCEPSVELVERIDANELDLAIVTDCGSLARLGDLPPRAAAVGDVEPPFDPSGGAAAARARPAELRLAARRDRMPGDDRPAASHRSTPAPMPARSPPPCCPGLRCRCSRNPGCGPACACSIPADGFPELPGCRVGLIRNPHESLALADALAEHIISSLDNLVGSGASGGVIRRSPGPVQRDAQLEISSIRVFVEHRLDRAVPRRRGISPAAPPPA